MAQGVDGLKGKKKVLVVGFAFTPGSGGEGGTTYGWAKSLFDQGCDVTVLYHPGASGGFQSHLVPFRTLPLSLGDPWDQLKRWEWRLWYQTWLHFAEKAVRRERFDAVISVSFSSLLFHNPFFRANAEARLIAGTGPLRWPSAVEKPRDEILTSKMHALAERVALPSLRRWGHVLPSNPETHAWLSRNGLSPAPVELDIGLWQLPDPVLRRRNANRVVTFSNTFFIARKGLGFAVELFRELPSLSLDVFGRDWGGKVAGIMRQAPVNVRWHGEVSRQTLLESLPDYDAIFLPSLRENTGSPAIEALAFGLPVASFRGSGPGEVLGERAGLSLTPDMSLAKQEMRWLPRVIEGWTEQRAVHNRARASENLWPRKAERLRALLFPAPAAAVRLAVNQGQRTRNEDPSTYQQS